MAEKSKRFFDSEVFEFADRAAWQADEDAEKIRHGIPLISTNKATGLPSGKTHTTTAFSKPIIHPSNGRVIVHADPKADRTGKDIKKVRDAKTNGWFADITERPNKKLPKDKDEKEGGKRS
jgi:hypothetical protein